MPAAVFVVLRRLAGSRLTGRFTLFFVVLAATPLLVLGGVSLSLITLAHQHDVSTLELQLIAEKAEEVEKFLADTAGVLNVRVGFEAVAPIDPGQQGFVLEGLLKDAPAATDARLINLDGQPAAERSRTAGAVDCRDVEGDTCASQADLPEFRAAAGGASFTGDVHQTLGGPAVTMAAPVRNRNGAIVQVAVAEVSLAPLVRSIAAAGLGGSGYLALLDRWGAVIARGGPGERIPGDDLATAPRVQRILRGELLDGLEVDDRYESLFDRTPVVGAGQRLPGAGWSLLVEWPVDDADALVDDIRRQVVWFTLLATLSVLLLAPLFAARLLRPIQSLAGAAAEVQQGNFDHRVAIATNDELEELGAAFNRMATGLKRLQELRNEFVFIAAHELRTPVTAIKGYLSIVFEERGSTLTADVRKSLETVARANDRLVQLVNDILEIARSEAGRLKVAVAPVDVREGVRGILAEVQPLAAERHLIVTYDPPADLPLVLADASRLQEVVMNFVSNAVKYNRDGGAVTVSHAVRGGLVVTAIADTGYGLSADDQRHLFEKFFRSEAAEFRDVPGTGLGLFITRELVEKMGGTVGLSSERGRGSTFWFSLPVAA